MHSVSNAFFGALHENVNEDRSTLPVAETEPMTVVSGNIRFVRIFAKFPG